MNFVERARAEFNDRMTGAATPEAEVRRRAWAEFEEKGLPGRKVPAWRYSSAQALTVGEWPAPSRADLPEAARALRERWRVGFDVLMVVDGEVRLDESCVSTELALALGRPSLDRSTAAADAFVSLATATAKPGFALTLAPDARPVRPLLIVSAQAGDTFTPVFNTIRLGAHAALDLALIQVGVGASLRSEVARVELDRGARLRWVRVNEDDRRARQFAQTDVHLAADAYLEVAQINAGAAMSRTGLGVEIDGPGAAAHLFGLTFGRDQQQIDQRVEVNHRAAHTSSGQVFKGVLRDRARGTLNGKIFIAPGAQKVASMQLNHNLLLSPGAEANTHPELEIYADDVKANHGASIGRMDEDRIFYLMSRGLTREYARQLLAHAFVADVVMKITAEPLREFVEARVRDVLPEYM